MRASRPVEAPARRARRTLGLALATCVALVMTGTSACAATALSDRPTLRLDVFQSSPAITAPLDVEITLLNLTNRAYDVERVSLHLPEGLQSIRPDYNTVISEKLHTINQQEERVYSKGIQQVTMNPVKAILDEKTLLFVPGSYRFRAEVQIRESGTDTGTRSLYATQELELEPPLSAALRGGVIGALLLALFVPAYQALNFRTRLVGGLQEAAKQAVIYFVSGAVVSVTAILVIHRVGSANLPITISVNDYLGGVIVGLLSYVFGNALYSQFFRKAGEGDEARNVEGGSDPSQNNPNEKDP